MYDCTKLTPTIIETIMMGEPTVKVKVKSLILAAGHLHNSLMNKVRVITAKISILIITLIQNNQPNQS
jgi:hypothetical protein